MYMFQDSDMYYNDSHARGITLMTANLFIDTNVSQSMTINCWYTCVTANTGDMSIRTRGIWHTNDSQSVYRYMCHSQWQSYVDTHVSQLMTDDLSIHARGITQMTVIFRYARGITLMTYNLFIDTHVSQSTTVIYRYTCVTANDRRYVDTRERYHTNDSHLSIHARGITQMTVICRYTRGVSH